jgi:hypothetical protein
MTLTMRPLLTALILLCPLAAFSQEANTAVLTLVDEGTFNKMKIDLEVIIGDSTATSTLTGTIDVRLNIDLATALTDELTILSADVSGTNITLAARSFLGRYSINSSGLKLDASTFDPPGEVAPATGEFDSSQYRFTVKEGTLAGTATIYIAPPPTDVNFDFSEEPFDGAGTGTGTVTLTPTQISDGKQFYDVIAIMPIAIEQTIEDIGGTGQSANTLITSTLKAVGTTFVELPYTYETWAAEQSLAIDSQNELSLSSNTPNFHLYALGFEATTTPPEQLIYYRPFGMIVSTGGEGLSRGELEIQWSADMETWTRVPDEEMVSGSSLINEGVDLENDIVAGFGTGTGARYYRIARVAAP